MFRGTGKIKRIYGFVKKLLTNLRVFLYNDKTNATMDDYGGMIENDLESLKGVL